MNLQGGAVGLQPHAFEVTLAVSNVLGGFRKQGGLILH